MKESGKDAAYNLTPSERIRIMENSEDNVICEEIPNFKPTHW
jgi:hypothetical protein